MNKCVRVNIKDDYDIIVDRSTKWGNPFSHKEKTRALFKSKSRMDSINQYKKWILYGEGKHLLNDLFELRGKRIACWCRYNQSCHGDILADLVNNIYYNNLNNFFKDES